MGNTVLKNGMMENWNGSNRPWTSVGSKTIDAFYLLFQPSIIPGW